VRYGNVAGSRGSVIPIFLQQRENGVLTITDERMTRFWLSLEQGVRFTIRAIEQMQGGEIFVPKIPSMRIAELAKAIAPDSTFEVIGIRPGEKLHEVLISEDDARHCVELDDMYVVEPSGTLWFGHAWREKGKPLPEGYIFASNTNENWLNEDEIAALIESSTSDK
jgi:UDP-N-acetylglucosamine 4,6-dehydratase